MVNCSCSRFHVPVANSITTTNFEFPYKQIPQRQSQEIKSHVTIIKISIYNRIISELSTYNEEKVNNYQQFKTRFESSKSFHKLVKAREKVEIQLEKILIDCKVEKMYPDTFERENECDPNETVGYNVRYGSHSQSFYKTYKFNVITGRCKTYDGSSYYSDQKKEVFKNFESLMKKELEAMLDIDSSSCSIA